MLACQVSLYPLAAENFSEIITNALAEIKKIERLTIEVGPMSTYIVGEDNLVWEAISLLFAKSKENGEKIVMNLQISNECGCDL